MKIKVKLPKIVVFLFLASFCCAFNFGNAADAAQRPTEQKATPTPAQTPIVKPSESSAAPKIVPTPAPSPVQRQTVAELQTKIRNVLSRTDLRRGHVGVKIVSLDSNKLIFEENAEKYFIPASNMKSYTVAAALEKLSPDFRFVTSVYAGSAPSAGGVIKGDLTIFGRGDVSFSTAFYEGDYYKGLSALAEKIAQSGVKRIEGDLIGDESYFTGNPVPEGWEWDDLQWYYGAEISALPVNDNAVDLSVKPAADGSPCAVRILPANTIVKVINRCATVAATAKRDIQVVKKLDQNILEIRGVMPERDKGFDGYIAVSRPAQLFVEMLRGLLIQKGITVAGQNKVINATEKLLLNVATSSAPVEIARLESPPLSLIAAKTMKPSQNTYTETILWTLGEEINRKQAAASAAKDYSNADFRKSSSAELGLKVVRDFLAQAGISNDSVVQWDGSGLSRHNLITPASAVQLYSHMARSRYATAWRDSLTVGAIDGTLKNRFTGTAAAANARGKTGTIDQVSSLSGYVTTAAGEQIVFSIIINGVNETRIRQAAIDEIVVALANFDAKIN